MILIRVGGAEDSVVLIPLHLKSCDFIPTQLGRRLRVFFKCHIHKKEQSYLTKLKLNFVMKQSPNKVKNRGCSVCGTCSIRSAFPSILFSSQMRYFRCRSPISSSHTCTYNDKKRFLCIKVNIIRKAPSPIHKFEKLRQRPKKIQKASCL